MRKSVFFVSALLLLLLWCTVCSGASVEADMAEGNSTVTGSDGGVAVDVGSHKWSRPWGVIITAIVLFVMAALAPFVVPKLISVFIHHHKDDEIAQSSAYGTFDHTMPVIRTPSIAHNSNVLPTDLPPAFHIKWDKSAWRLIHRQLDRPVALAVSAALLSCAIGVLQLPSRWDEIYIRRIANTIAQLFLIITACFALHRIIELVIEFIEMQAWLARTHMQKLYEEIAGKVGLAIKILGTMIIIVSVLGLTDEEGWSRKIFFAFVTATVLVVVGWMFLELSDTAAELESSAAIMLMNMFAIGDTVEFYYMENGKVCGVVEEINTRTTLLRCKGKPIYVVNTFFLRACVINITRSAPILNLTVYVASKHTDAEKMRKFVEGARRIVAEASIVEADSAAHYKGAVSCSLVPLFLTAAISPTDDPAVVKAQLMLQLLDLAKSLEVRLSE